MVIEACVGDLFVREVFRDVRAIVISIDSISCLRYNSLELLVLVYYLYTVFETRTAVLTN